MKKGWRIALATAATAIVGLIPYSYKKDEESGASVLQALLWSCTKKPDGEKQIIIGLHIGSMPLPKTPADCPEECPDECPPESEEASADIL